MYQKIRTEEMSLVRVYKTAFSILSSNIKIFLISSLLIGVPLLFYSIFSEIHFILSGIFYLAYIFILPSVIGGLTNLVLALSDGKEAKLEDVLEGSIYKIGSYILPTIAHCIIFIIGLLLFVIPGIYVGVLFMFYPCAIIVTNQSGIKALIESKKVVKGRWFKTFGFALSYLFLLAFIIVTGFIGFGLYVLLMSFFIGYIIGYNILWLILLFLTGLIGIMILASMLVFVCTLEAVWFVNKYYIDNPKNETEALIATETVTETDTVIEE